jgi:ParB family chromosome partitioning protein
MLLEGPAPEKPEEEEEQPPEPLSPHDQDMLRRFESRLGTRVKLARGKEGSGRIVIHFYSDEELDAIYRAILGDESF